MDGSHHEAGLEWVAGMMMRYASSVIRDLEDLGHEVVIWSADHCSIGTCDIQLSVL